MLCPQCNTPLVGPSCPCGWADEPPSFNDLLDEPLPSYFFKELIPEEFLMGSPLEEEGRDPDETLHTVILTKPYAIGCTEVTQDLFTDVMRDNPSGFIGNRKPVDSVSWMEACSFCNAYSVHMGLEPVYKFQDTFVHWEQQASGYRLPTEAEWEYAARQAQNQSPLSTKAWFQENSGLETQVVGRNRGISDMAGNVWEWVWDWYAPYPEQSIDPFGPQKGEYRVARGGCWADGPRVIRAANRAYQAPNHESNTIGFRLAQSLLPQKK
jgi:sulfatase modifying factor 1